MNFPWGLTDSFSQPPRHGREFHEIVYPFGPSKFDAERLTLPEMPEERMVGPRPSASGTRTGIGRRSGGPAAARLPGRRGFRLVESRRSDAEADPGFVDAKSGGITPVPPWFDEENGYRANSHDAALFDLDVDLGQRHNRIVEYPEKAEKLRALLKRIRDSGYSAPRLSKRGVEAGSSKSGD